MRQKVGLAPRSTSFSRSSGSGILTLHQILSLFFNGIILKISPLTLIAAWVYYHHPWVGYIINVRKGNKNGNQVPP